MTNLCQIIGGLRVSTKSLFYLFLFKVSNVKVSGRTSVMMVVKFHAALGEIQYSFIT